MDDPVGPVHPLNSVDPMDTAVDSATFINPADIQDNVLSVVVNEVLKSGDLGARINGNKSSELAYTVLSEGVELNGESIPDDATADKGKGISNISKRVPIRSIPEIRLSSFDNDEDIVDTTNGYSAENKAIIIGNVAITTIMEEEPQQQNGATNEVSNGVNGTVEKPKSEVNGVNGEQHSPESSAESTGEDKKKKKNKPPRKVRISECNDVYTLERQGDTPSPGPKVSSRHVAILIGFNGLGQHGTCNQTWIRRVPSVSRDIVTGIVETGHVYRLRRNDIVFSARTARDVSAQRYVFSAVVTTDKDNEFLVEAFQKAIPDHIRLFGMRTVVNSFNAKRSCVFHREPRDIHLYSYYVPSFAFAPPDIEPNFDYRIAKERMDEIDQFLSKFQGDRLFHNFTSLREATYDFYATSRRYLVSFGITEVTEIDGIELICVGITGQSFMVFQICHMIGLAIAFFRGKATQEIVDSVWKAPLVTLPRAPGLGLVLKEVRYCAYNEKIKRRIKLPKDLLIWDKEDQMTEDFLQTQILPSIVKTEKEEKSMLKFLEYLDTHDYEFHPKPPSEDKDSPRSRSSNSMSEVKKTNQVSPKKRSGRRKRSSNSVASTED